MSATERLRELLDERGVEWTSGYTEVSRNIRTDFCPDAGVLVSVWENDGKLGIDAHTLYRFTPEQAIAATLGPGTCMLDGYTDAAFRVVQAPEYTDFIDYAEVCECSACGASVIVPHEYERVTAGSDELWPKFNYCPNCGRKVMDE